MRNYKFRFATITVIALFLLTGCSGQNSTTSEKSTESSTSSQDKELLESLGLENQNGVDTWETPLEISVQEGSYMWAGTLEGKILEADNVFVATVENMTTEYSDSAYDENGELVSSITTTIFKLKVLENIRGELPIDTSVQASRVHFGQGDGVLEGYFITAIENDIIPEVGKTYVFLARAIEGELVISNGGEVPSNFPLENAPMDLNKQSEAVIDEIVDSSTKIEEIKEQVNNETAVFEEIGSSLLNAEEIQNRIDGNGNKLDMDKVVVD